ncbi:hypothetical protein IFM89_033411 [Coptis chinensis]|uniref:Calmodulin-binding protein n=1 Tax=Coptis chinensis TaxID=261450 RepID=A0A835HYK5_9MAGN|nr:hypothetical protein IFM89_033411 [Coptis chinensis]
MVPKRHFNEEGRLGLNSSKENPVQETNKRRQTFDEVVRYVTKGLSEQDFLTNFEPLIRKVVREEVERVFQSFLHLFPRSSLKLETSRSRSVQLHFITQLRNTLYTGNRIVGEDGEPIQIVVLDANSKRIVTTGPLSSIKIEIVVLDGEFGSDAKEDWTAEEFDACVIREREGRRPLVTGDLQVIIRGGVGYLGDLVFTDNSSWMRSRKFRLGATVVSSSCSEEGIREGRSEAFIVKDHRGVLYEKHHPPSLGDEVWRLERIGKDGAFHLRLASHNVNTVQDLLRLAITDPSHLRRILGNGMSNKTWETIVQHASSCILDNKRYVYYNSGRQVQLMFDSVYRLLGATFAGEIYKSLESLTATQMSLVESLKQDACRNLNDMVEIDWPLVDASSVVFPLEDFSYSGPSLDPQLPGLPVICEDQPATLVGLSNTTCELRHVLEDLGHLDFIQGIPLQFLSSIHRNSFTMKGQLASYENDGNQWDPGESSSSNVMGGHFTRDDISLVQLSNSFPTTATWGQSSGVFLASGDEMGTSVLSPLYDISFSMNRNRKPNMGWFKIRAAVKWGISGRRYFAARRRERALQLVH